MSLIRKLPQGLKLVRESSLGLAQSLQLASRDRDAACQRRWSSGSGSSAVRGDLKSGEADVAIVGGGIVGLATAREIVTRFPCAKVVVVEKEQDIVKHQTSHNSGVIHAGIYYEPGSDMAKLCVDGARLMYEYCEKKKLPHKRVGKLIVATRDSELPILEDLFQRASANGVQGLELLSPKQILDLEPNVRALRALHSPNTGIVDYAKVGRSYAEDVLATGRGQIRTGFEVTGVDADATRGVTVQSRAGEEVKAKWLITCGGLQADYVGNMAGGAKGPTILPFRGTYHELKPEYRNLITRNIYPVPDPKFPMVGVHLTPRVDGRVLIGPNSALALSKEGYKFWKVSAKDSLLFAVNKGLWKLVLGNPGIVFQEIWRDINTRAFVGEAQRYCPKLEVEHTTHGWAGVHAVAVDAQGKIVGNFLFENGSSGLVLNVRNAPSPACTSSLAIANTVVDRAVKDFDWLHKKPFLTPTKSLLDFNPSHRPSSFLVSLSPSLSGTCTLCLFQHYGVQVFAIDLHCIVDAIEVRCMCAIYCQTSQLANTWHLTNTWHLVKLVFANLASLCI